MESDFEEGRKYEQLKREILSSSRRILSGNTNGELRDNGYLIFRTKIELFAEMSSRHYAYGRKEALRVLRKGIRAKNELERLMGEERVTQLNQTYSLLNPMS